MTYLMILRAVLGMIGVAIIFLGLNIGLGGMQTLGWQIPTGFLAVLDQKPFDVQDNHIRFLGGFWFAIGGIYLLSAVFFEKLQQFIVIVSFAVAVGGIFRLSALDFDILLSGQILPSLILEMLFFPAIALWALGTIGKTG